MRAWVKRRCALWTLVIARTVINRAQTLVRLILALRIAVTVTLTLTNRLTTPVGWRGRSQQSLTLIAVEMRWCRPVVVRTGAHRRPIDQAVRVDVAQDAVAIMTTSVILPVRGAGPLVVVGPAPGPDLAHIDAVLTHIAVATGTGATLETAAAPGRRSRHTGAETQGRRKVTPPGNVLPPMPTGPASMCVVNLVLTLLPQRNSSSQAKPQWNSCAACLVRRTHVSRRPSDNSSK